MDILKTMHCYAEAASKYNIEISDGLHRDLEVELKRAESTGDKQLQVHQRCFYPHTFIGHMPSCTQSYGNIRVVRI